MTTQNNKDVNRCDSCTYLTFQRYCSAPKRQYGYLLHKCSYYAPTFGIKIAKFFKKIYWYFKCRIIIMRTKNALKRYVKNVQKELIKLQSIKPQPSSTNMKTGGIVMADNEATSTVMLGAYTEDENNKEFNITLKEIDNIITVMNKL